MPAPQHGYVIADCECVVVEVGDRIGAAPYVVLVGNRHLQSIRHSLIEIDAESRSVNVVRGIPAVIAPPQQRDVERIHDSRTDRVSLAKRKGLHPLRVSGLRRDENVARGVESRKLIAVDEIAAVGTNACVAAWDCFDCVRWYPAKAKSLSRRIGPPKVPPNWFWCNVSFVEEKKLLALM